MISPASERISFINNRGTYSPMPRLELTMAKAYIILSTLRTPRTTYAVRRALGDEPRKRVKAYLDQLLKLGHIESQGISEHFTSNREPTLYRTTKLGDAFVCAYQKAEESFYNPNPIGLW